MKTSNPANIIMPRESDSQTLSRLAQEDEHTCLVLRLTSNVGLTPYRYRGLGMRSYIFRYDKTLACHVLRLPVSVAHANNAEVLNDIFGMNPMHNPIIPHVEEWKEGSWVNEQTTSRDPHDPRTHGLESPGAIDDEEANSVETSEISSGKPSLSIGSVVKKLLTGKKP